LTFNAVVDRQTRREEDGWMGVNTKSEEKERKDKK
jgi:hypothetical protein